MKYLSALLIVSGLCVVVGAPTQDSFVSVFAQSGFGLTAIMSGYLMAPIAEE